MSSVFCASIRGGACRRYGVLELIAGRRLGGDGQVFPITERHRVCDIGHDGPDYLAI